MKPVRARWQFVPYHDLTVKLCVISNGIAHPFQYGLSWIKLNKEKEQQVCTMWTTGSNGAISMDPPVPIEVAKMLAIEQLYSLGIIVEVEE